MSGVIRTVYFSPTGSARAVTSAVAGELAALSGKKTAESDWTFPNGRGKESFCSAEDVLVFGFPVYAGRVPEVLEASMAGLHGQETPAVVLAVYGNRHYDDALLEGCDLLHRNGFVVVAAAAFVAEHSLTAKVGAGRPDAADMAATKDFARQAAPRIAARPLCPVAVKGQRPYKERPAAHSIVPKTTASCTDCLLCAHNCPMGVISTEDPRIVREGCIRCCACVRFCPEQAKFFDDPGMARIRAMLESRCLARREPEFFV